MSESLVDLLLVRLGREEEKRKVLKLLVTSLDLSVSDAEEAVNNSPSVIREAVPMAEARAIQKDLYPYIDLLPRFDDEEEPDEALEDAPEDVTDDMTEDSSTDGILESGESMEADEEEPEKVEEATAAAEEEEEEDETADMEESILITSASDEVRSTNRCHICGRTPTNGEKLAPCRTCQDLTCRDCFDRIAHVCSKCAASGKSVEYVNEGVEPEKEHGLVFDSEETVTRERPSGSGIGRYIVAGVLVILALAAAFYFMDPMDLFNDGSIGEVAELTPLPDTSVTEPGDSLGTVVPDSSTVVEPDTTETVEPVVPDEDPLGISSLALPDEYSLIENPPPVAFRTTKPSSVRADILRDESRILAEQLSVIAAWIPVQIDDAALLQYHDSTQVLVIALTHPEETEVRLELLRRVADWLTPTGIDQLVLYYRENRYQSTIIMSLVSSDFQAVQGILSPGQFQDHLHYREDCWASISGPVSEWLTNIQ